MFHVRVLEKLSSKINRPGDTFMVTLDEALVVDGFVLAERGAHGEGKVVDSSSGGRLTGPPLLSLELTQISTSDGQNVALHTNAVDREGASPAKADAVGAGAGAVLGSVIGAAAGGGKGAAIGAAAGAAAGAGTAIATRRKPATIPSELPLTFRLQDPITLTERLGR